MRYARQGAEARWARSFPQKELVMTQIERYNHDGDADPVISFASDAEIELADRLRHRLEQRYFARSAPSADRSDENSPNLRPVDDAGGAP
jgi:hypothetical protein